MKFFLFYSIFTSVEFFYVLHLQHKLMPLDALQIVQEQKVMYKD
jgi:predicted permease